MSCFRSEVMTSRQLILQCEVGYSCVAALGELGLVQFKDINPCISPYQRKYYKEIQRCHEIERQLRFFKKELANKDISTTDVIAHVRAPQPRELQNLENKLKQLETVFVQQISSTEQLIRTHAELTEFKNAISKTQILCDMIGAHYDRTSVPSTSNEDVNLLDEIEVNQGTEPTILRFVSGVISRIHIQSFEKMLWRACLGLAFLRHTEIENPIRDPITGALDLKDVFIVFYHGDKLKDRVRKICDGFRARVYDCGRSRQERDAMHEEIVKRIEELNIILQRTHDHCHDFLVEVSKNIDNWYVQVLLQKSIYNTLNMFDFDVTKNCLVAEFWCALADVENVQRIIFQKTSCSSTVPALFQQTFPSETPPTYCRTNKFTQGFQNIIDAYGIANYQEINPAVFTIITFPFLFAVMFGDSGHGFLLSLFAAWMIFNEGRSTFYKCNNEIFQAIFDGRYIILLMGLFSIYTGLIYNDMFSKSMNIFGSSWNISADFSWGQLPDFYQLNPTNNTDYSGIPYSFGIDPTWQVSTNKLLLHNSFKMKAAIIFGVLHMTLGIFLSYYNYRHFKQPLHIVCDFLPRLVFFLSIFGYLVCLIFTKWYYYDANVAGCAPSLLVMFVNMFMMTYPNEPCYLVSIYSGQAGLQGFLLFVAVFCIFWMWLGEAAFLYWKRNRHVKRLTVHWRRERRNFDSGDDMDMDEVSPLLPLAPDENTESSNLGEMFLERSINTIEFCLGSISHTASYLRLWALSLAHAQLSEVLWEMVLRRGISFKGWGGCIVIYFMFAAWACFTVSILLIMEGFSAFLHSLRLHWLEFQSKFYKGAGHSFLPFCFDDILKNSEY